MWKQLFNASVPVIIKEVGFGMSKELLQSLVNIGVTYVDVEERVALILSR